jgi:hypothetical protein
MLIMAIFDHERKNGIQLGTVGDRCMECDHKHRMDEEYEPERLDYKPVYKFWVNNLSHCMCLDCFKESLGKYVLLDPDEIVEEKPKAKKQTKKKEADKDGETA